MAKNEQESFRIIRGGLYGKRRTAEERMQLAIQERYARVKNRRGVSPGGPWYDAARGKTHPMSELASHTIRAKNAGVTWEEIRDFILGINEAAMAMASDVYGKNHGPERGSAA